MTKLVWSERENPIDNRRSTHSTSVGKIKLTFDSENLRLRASIGSNMTFIEPREFVSTDDIKEYADSNADKLSAIKSMNQLIKQF